MKKINGYQINWNRKRFFRKSQGFTWKMIIDPCRKEITFYEAHDSNKNSMSVGEFNGYEHHFSLPDGIGKEDIIALIESANLSKCDFDETYNGQNYVGNVSDVIDIEGISYDLYNFQPY
jgi:hypothetical protein